MERVQPEIAGLAAAPRSRTRGSTISSGRVLSQAAQVARRSLELVQAAPDPRVVGQLLALVDELGKGGRGRDSRAPALPQTRLPGGLTVERASSAPGASTRGVVDPLVTMLRATGKGDAGALARLLGQALAQAEELLTKPS